MDDQLFFRLYFLCYYVAMLGIAVYFRRRGRAQGLRTERDETAVAREGRGRLGARRVTGLLMIAAALLYVIFPPFMASLQAPIPEFVRWAAVGLGLVSLPLLWWVLDALGRMWSRNLQLQEGHELITTGPYARVRHPMYALIFMAMTTVALVSASWLMIVPAVGAMLAIYSRIPQEEAMLKEAFPGEYEHYMRRTGKLFPRLFFKVPDF